MFIRLVILSSLLFTGVTQGADAKNPLADELGKRRPLVVATRTEADPTLQTLKKALEEPANKQAFNERHMVLCTIERLTGNCDGNVLDQPTTMALLRSLKQGVINEAKVVVIAKDGSMMPLPDGTSDLSTIFAAVDKLSQQEKEVVLPESKPAAAEKSKPGKSTTPTKTPKPLED